MNEVHEQQPQTEVKNPGKAAKATPLVLSLSFHGGLLVLLDGAALVPAYVQKPEMVA
jgi:hypothetical protein